MIAEFVNDNLGNIVGLIIISIVVLQIALIVAILKIFTINKKMTELIILHDTANDTKIEQLGKIEKYLEIIAETGLHNINKQDTPTS